jgi:CubicO group peptidase (beta-lactamase class C family)
MKQTFLLFTILVLLLSGCASPAAQVPPTAPPAQKTAGQPGEPAVGWPTRGWPVSTPEEQGMDPAQLEKMQAVIKEKNIPLHSLLIVRNGAIVSERYYGSYDEDSVHRMYSVTKSFTSTLVGIAVDQGKLEGVELRALDLLPGRTFENTDERKRNMTLENLLTMTSGLDFYEGDSTYNRMYASEDWVQMVMDLPMHTEPGNDFLYCSGCSHVLSAIVQEAVGESTLKFAQKNLFEPLGMTNLRWETDRKGIPIGGWGLNITPRDMAKLGYLYLHNGAWDGKQIVSESWVKAASTRHTDTDGNLGYGYQWWIYPTHNAYAALGRYGQTIFVAPDLNLIVVTTAQIESGHDPIFDLIDHYILPSAEK